MNYHIPVRSHSLRNLQTFKETEGCGGAEEKSAAVISPPLRSSPARYQLWPSSALKTSSQSITPNASVERLNILSMGRSPTSLSDTAASEDSASFWQRAGSLTRRRKVSVPELGQTMTTVQEFAIDSRGYTLYVLSNTVLMSIQRLFPDGHHCERLLRIHHSTMKDPVAFQGVHGGQGPSVTH